MTNPLKKISVWLYGKGFNDAALRNSMLALLCLSAVSLAAGALLWMKSTLPLTYFVGVALVTYNFWAISRFIFKRFSGAYSRELASGQMLGFFARFFMAGGVIAVCLLLGASPFALAAGLVSGTVVIMVVALLRLARQNK